MALEQLPAEITAGDRELEIAYNLVPPTEKSEMVDHGLETPEVREGAGKGEGTISLRTEVKEGTLIVELVDDGAGIRWDKVKEKAVDAGLPHATREDLKRALFSDGLSTASDTTDVSGRGVGTAALWAEVERLGGSIKVESAEGKGSAFTFMLPAGQNLATLTPKMTYEYRSVTLESRA